MSLLSPSSILKLILLYLICFINPSVSTFIKSHSCELKQQQSKLQPFIIDVAIDTNQKKLKFFINTQVSLYNGFDTDRHPAITNYNSSTDKYTSLHIDINFMGKQFINETKRFCDMVSVKNTTSFLQSPRFNNSYSNFDKTGYNLTDINNGQDFDQDKQSSTTKKNSHRHEEIHSGISFNNNSLIDRMNRTSLGSTDSTITELFSNSTGNLVQCPLYYNDSIMIYYEADISEHFHRIGSYQIKFTVLNNDAHSSCIACSNTYVTPIQPAFINDTITLGVLILVCVAIVVNIFTVSFSSYQESTNPYLFKASTICNEKLLNQIDASVPDILMYLQYALFLGGLDLLYPGFYQPMLGQIKWCALLTSSMFGKSSSWDSEDEDNVYVTLSGGGLSSLTMVDNNNPIVNNWPNFMALLLMVIVLMIVAKQIFIGIKLLFDKIIEKAYKKIVKNNSSFEFWSKKNLYLIIGQVLQIWLIVFGMPFLILSSFLFLSANDINGKHRSLSNFHQLKKGAFSFTTPYNELIVPQQVFTFGLRTSSLEGFHRAPIPKTPISEGGSNIAKKFDSDSWLTTLKSPQIPFNSTFNSSIINPSLYSNITNTATTSSTTPRNSDHDYMNISNASLALSSILFSCWVIFLIFFIFHYLLSFSKKIKIKNSSNINKLYTNLKTILMWSFLYYEYKPQRVKCVIISISILFSNSMVIGLLQNHGLIQVILLIIISIIDLFQLFVLKPYFVPIKFWSTKFIFPVAKFLCIILCIGFLREVDATEAVRTIIAYIHLLIHVIVAFVFIFQLTYWFFRTCMEIYKSYKSNKEANLINQLSEINSIDEFERQFEYKAVNNLRNNNERRVSGLFSSDEKSIDESLNNQETYSMDGVDEEFLFRRGPQRLGEPENNNNNNINSDEIISITESQSSFLRLQHESNLRKLNNNYKIREVDQIYEKYFMDDKIDPEVKELWESRKFGTNNNSHSNNKQQNLNNGNKNLQTSPAFGQNCTTTTTSPISLSKLRNVANSVNFKHNKQQQQSRKETGFQVSRPRQLIVKTIEEIQQEQLQKQIELETRLKNMEKTEVEETGTFHVVNHDSNDDDNNVDDSINDEEKQTEDHQHYTTITTSSSCSLTSNLESNSTSNDSSMEK
ncbi:uncharacterized protein KGF55_002256 [Candida pseudojiufengensis]|uniref:uncharacterized protein n=1 Tax=Candida pseudojiufengensis TaxID=497109 RepID=UPI002224AB9D|nr:uncharacterized protein KGF55_002256 [Candida pseudojiufengensis]KAI5964314.1 hypothetical protein KGF55_002256 [Candida pseudojiufengensis]